MRRRAILIISVVAAALLWGAGGSFAAGESGYLSGTGEYNTFSVDAGLNSYIEVLFSYPGGSADFGVRVIDHDMRTVLGDYRLNESRTVPLSGGGIFYLTIYSIRGAGNWSASYYDPITSRTIVVVPYYGYGIVLPPGLRYGVPVPVPVPVRPVPVPVPPAVVRPPVVPPPAVRPPVARPPATTLPAPGRPPRHDTRGRPR